MAGSIGLGVGFNNPTSRLYTALTTAGIPVVSTRQLDAVTFAIQYAVTATPAQITAGNAILAGFDPSATGQTNFDNTKFPNRVALHNNVAGDIAANNAFIALGPVLTLTQVTTQLIALTQQ